MKPNGAGKTCAISIVMAAIPLAATLQTGTGARSFERTVSHTTLAPKKHPTNTSKHSLLLFAKTSDRHQYTGRRQRKKRLDQLQKQRRRNRWVRRYGTVDALKQTFGTGPPWGDLSPAQTRALYHTLLPRSLLALNEMGLIEAEDLAPLAYEARIAAKEYARSRCVWTGRIGVFLFDQYRSLRDRGRLLAPGKSSSMTWEEIWSKYERQITKEYEEKGQELNEDDLMMMTYMRILERSCSTNQTVDSMFLREDAEEYDRIDLDSIAYQLERDVRAILLSQRDFSKAEKQVNKEVKRRRKEQKREDKMQFKLEKKMEKQKR